ncbi:hypothetical protein EMN47_11580 [Prolixibacteraceae bacterium JC049]|nr:hypothetical protein [Prolixibacteraceae bacterium JC049]
MQRVITSFMLLLVLTMSGYAQKKVYVGLGVNRSSFQDQKFSDLHIVGNGLNFQYGIEKLKEKKLVGFDLQVFYSNETPSTYKYSTSVFRPVINYYHLRKINDRLFIGGKWNIADIYLRTTEGLGNNGSYMDFSSNLMASAVYYFPLGKKKLKAAIDLGLIGYTKSSTSFAYKAPHPVLVDGKFNMQNSSINTLMGKAGAEFKPVWDDIRLNMELTYAFSKRLEVCYQWKLRRYSTVKNYPTTYGMNAVTFRYNIKNR